MVNRTQNVSIFTITSEVGKGGFSTLREGTSLVLFFFIYLDSKWPKLEL